MGLEAKRKELEAEREAYVAQMEGAETEEDLRRWLSSIHAVDAQLAALARAERNAAAPTAPVGRTRTAPLLIHPPPPHDDRWLHDGDDWLETIDTSLYQPAAPRRDDSNDATH